MITHKHPGAIHGLEFDLDADAFYVRLSDKPYAYGKDLDSERRIDYAEDGTPIGVEITCLKSGVVLDDLPNQDDIRDILSRFLVPIST